MKRYKTTRKTSFIELPFDTNVCQKNMYSKKTIKKNARNPRLCLTKTKTRQIEQYFCLRLLLLPIYILIGPLTFFLGFFPRSACFCLSLPTHLLSSVYNVYKNEFLLNKNKLISQQSVIVR